MPRRYAPRSRYCPGSKLSEEELVAVLKSWPKGMNATEAAAELKEQGFPLSRQTLNAYFLSIGFHVYRAFVRPVLTRRHPGADESEAWGADLERGYLYGMYLRVTGQLPYDEMRKRGGYDALLASDKYVELLQARRKKFRGFSRDKIASHYAFAFWRCLNQEGFMSEDAAWNGLLDLFSKHPLESTASGKR